MIPRKIWTEGEIAQLRTLTIKEASKRFGVSSKTIYNARAWYGIKRVEKRRVDADKCRKIKVEKKAEAHHMAETEKRRIDAIDAEKRRMAKRRKIKAEKKAKTRRMAERRRLSVVKETGKRPMGALEGIML
jgi:transposase